MWGESALSFFEFRAKFDGFEKDGRKEVKRKRKFEGRQVSGFRWLCWMGELMCYVVRLGPVKFDLV